MSSVWSPPVLGLCTGALGPGEGLGRPMLRPSGTWSYQGTGVGVCVLVRWVACPAQGAAVSESLRVPGVW